MAHFVYQSCLIDILTRYVLTYVGIKLCIIFFGMFKCQFNIIYDFYKIRRASLCSTYNACNVDSNIYDSCYFWKNVGYACRFLQDRSKLYIAPNIVILIKKLYNFVNPGSTQTD